MAIPPPEIKPNENKPKTEKVESGRPMEKEVKNGQVQYRTIKGNLYLCIKHDDELFVSKMKRMSEVE
tara:strand:+ start:311 stop:511 length:201 start_codon:yes stop_codon:yes gene_type:complete